MRVIAKPRRYGPVRLFGPGYVEPGLRIRETRPKPHPAVPRATKSRLGCDNMNHLDYTPRVSHSRNDFRSPRLSRNAATMRQCRVASGIRKSLAIMGNMRETHEVVGPCGSLGKGKKQQSALKESVQATPQHLPVSRLTESRPIPDFDSTNFGVTAREMIAVRLECGGGLRGSAGKCWPKERAPPRISSLRLWDTWTRALRTVKVRRRKISNRTAVGVPGYVHGVSAEIAVLTRQAYFDTHTHRPPRRHDIVNRVAAQLNIRAHPTP